MNKDLFGLTEQQVLHLANALGISENEVLRYLLASILYGQEKGLENKETQNCSLKKLKKVIEGD